MNSPALRLAARYSLPPCQLGFCGPLDKKSRQILYDFACGDNALAEGAREALTKFEAMYPYLCLIASCSDISDPFDERVVKAFWVGNELLDNVKTEDLRRMILTDFVGSGRMSLQDAKARVAKIPDGAVSHHSFHVLVLGSVTGRVKFTNALRDLCRVSWGRVVKIKNQISKIKNTDEKLKVKSRPLVVGKDGRMKLGEEVGREVDLDRRLVPGVKIGDWVSLHWGQVCDVLSEEDVTNLERYTRGMCERAAELSAKPKLAH